MYWQQYFKGESGEGPATAREAAKDCIRNYVLLDWDVEHFPTRTSSVAGWDAQIGGSLEDDQGQPQMLRPDQLAITRLQNRPCLAVFFLTELIAEIRREAGKEPENAPKCLYCGTVLDNQPTGRDRRYCDNKGKCKQAYHRKMQREEQRAALLEEHAELRDMWEEQHISDQLLTLLQNILIDQGEEAARTATDAIRTYAQQERERSPQKQPPQNANSQEQEAQQSVTPTWGAPRIFAMGIGGAFESKSGNLIMKWTHGGKNSSSHGMLEKAVNRIGPQRAGEVENVTGGDTLSSASCR